MNRLFSDVNSFNTKIINVEKAKRTRLHLESRSLVADLIDLIDVNKQVKDLRDASTQAVATLKNKQHAERKALEARHEEELQALTTKQEKLMVPIQRKMVKGVDNLRVKYGLKLDNLSFRPWEASSLKRDVDHQTDVITIAQIVKGLNHYDNLGLSSSESNVECDKFSVNGNNALLFTTDLQAELRQQALNETDPIRASITKKADDLQEAVMLMWTSETPDELHDHIVNVNALKRELRGMLKIHNKDSIEVEISHFEE